MLFKRTLTCDPFSPDQLDPSLLREERPREWEDWLVLYPMSDTFTVARAVLLSDNWTRQHWVVKMVRICLDFCFVFGLT